MMKVVHAGFDTLDIAFQGALQKADVARLMTAKESASESHDLVLAKIGPGEVEMNVHGYGTNSGYSFITDTGPYGEIWSLSKNTNPKNWNIRASVRSRTLVLLGYHGAVQQVLDRLDRMGCTVRSESVSRADFAIDILAPGTEIDIGRIVVSPRCKVEPYWGDDDIPVHGSNASAVFRGRRLTGFRVGAIRQRQVVMYDKRKAAIEKREPHWFKLWDVDPTDPNAVVWRIEVRLGKGELKDRYQIRSFTDFESGYGDAVLQALRDVRLVTQMSSDSNLGRRRNDPIWDTAINRVRHDLFKFRSGLTRDQLRDLDREAQITIYRQQILGNAAGLAVCLGLNESEIKSDFPEILAKEIRSAIKDPNQKFFRTYERSKEKKRFKDAELH